MTTKKPKTKKKRLNPADLTKRNNDARKKEIRALDSRMGWLLAALSNLAVRVVALEHEVKKDV